jgi:hypothetical protein
MQVSRHTVDLSAYPDLVVVYLGIRAHSVGGFLKIMKLGPQIARSAQARPDGLLHHEENLIYGLLPLHIGMRQYWRDFEALERWTRELPHMDWWRDLIARPQGVSVWHETYCMRGGIESVYLGAKEHGFSTGLLSWAPNVDPSGTMFTARRRLRREGADARAAAGE